MALRNLKLQSLAMHLLQQSTKGSPTQPVLSEDLTPLNAESKSFLEERLASALVTARPVTRDPSVSTEVPQVIVDYFDETRSLLDVSHVLAKSMQEVQSGISPAGLLLVLSGTRSGHDVLVLAKLEHERGARAMPTQVDGKRVYDMEFLRDLFLTTGSKVYKVALFPRDLVGSTIFSGELADRQIQGHGVAQYFLSDFLGCDYTQREDVLTENFHNATQKFVDGIADPATKARYQVALLSEMASNAPDLSVVSFAKTHLDESDQDDYVAQMRSAAVPLTFRKDIGLVRAHIDRVLMEFENGSLVLVPPDELGDGKTVRVADSRDGRTELQINDVLTKMGSKGALKSNQGSPDDA
jgi:hypothetical protein